MRGFWERLQKAERALEVLRQMVLALSVEVAQLRQELRAARGG